MFASCLAPPRPHGGEVSAHRRRLHAALALISGRALTSGLLFQVLLTGFLDNVARRAPPGAVAAGSRVQRSCAYLSCNEAVKEPLYIKNTSVLFSRDPDELPQWVVYQAC